MKALTLSQPWATAIAEGHKRIETRKWRPRENPGLLAITSSNKAMSRSQHERLASHFRDGVEFHRRSILAVVTITRFERTEAIRDGLDYVERSFGDYTDRRWAWVFGHIVPLPDPIELYPVSPGPGKKKRLPGALNVWTLPPVFTRAVESQIGPDVRRLER